jgi:hypothetical protein
MKVVIDIPNGRYEELMTDDIHLVVPIFKEDIIATLPNDHGRLIDADELKAAMHMNGYKGFATHHDVNVIFEYISNAPTIIETDKAESEGTTCQKKILRDS